MITTADQLAATARAINAAQEAALSVQPLLRRGNTAQAEEAALEAAARASDAAVRLQNIGVPAEAFHGIPSTNPLDLTQLDTPETRALLAELRPLVALAEKIDQARGRWYPDAPATDTKGTDIAETLHQLVCRLDLEVNGARGRD